MATTSTGFPDATNTGAPAGVTLTPSGGLNITKAGTVVSGLDISGPVYISAANVTLENCKITSSDFYIVRVADGVDGAVVKNCTIDGVGVNNDGSYGIFGNGAFTGNNIFNVENGIGMNGPSTVQDNYIHDLKASGAPHYDGIEIDSGHDITLSHNTVINDFGQTSAVMIDNYFGPISNIKVDNNVLSGGGYTVYSYGDFNSNPVTGVSITNNHMGMGQFGYTDFQGSNPAYTGNANDGAAVISTLNTPANSGPATTTSSGGATASTATDPMATASGQGHAHATGATMTATAATTDATEQADAAGAMTMTGAATATTADAAVAGTAATTAATAHADAMTTTGAADVATADAATAGTAATATTAAPHVDITGMQGAGGHHAVIKGLADANSQINVSDGAAQIGTATADANGHWTFKTAALSNAVHTFTATEADGAGQVTASSPGAAILGAQGADTLAGTAGNDVLKGGGQADTFVFAQNFGQDVIKDFNAHGAHLDTIQLSHAEFADFNSVLSHAQQIGHDVVITSGADQLTLKHANVGALTAQDFHFA